MVYKLWIDGQEQGPFTLAQLRERYYRGELGDALWRRIGESNYRPASELGLEVEGAELSSTGTANPNTASIGRVPITGGAHFCFGLSAIALLVGVAAIALHAQPVAAAGFGAFTTLLLLGIQIQIHEVLQVIAQRLARD